MESISKSKNFTSKTIKSPRQLIFGRDMISNVQILQIGSISMQVNNVDPGIITQTQRVSTITSLDKNMRCPLMALSVTYEMPFNGSHKKQMRNALYNGSHKKLKVITIKLYIFVLASLLIRENQRIKNNKQIWGTLYWISQNVESHYEWNCTSSFWLPYWYAKLNVSNPTKKSLDSIHGGECNMRLSKKWRRAHDWAHES